MYMHDMSGRVFREESEEILPNSDNFRIYGPIDRSCTLCKAPVRRHCTNNRTYQLSAVQFTDSMYAVSLYHLTRYCDVVKTDSRRDNSILYQVPESPE